MNVSEMEYIQSRVGRMNFLTIVVLLAYLLVIAGFIYYLCSTFTHTYETDKEHTEQEGGYNQWQREAKESAETNIDYKTEEGNWREKNKVENIQFVGSDGTLISPNYSINEKT